MAINMNIVICGVGGQGILLASDILCQVAFLEGYDVKKSEVHGMAQRGGSVITHVRFGEKVYAPLIELGSADFILGFEKLEALRYAHYLKKGGIFVVNNLSIPPMSVLVGDATYPSDIEQRLKKYGSVHLINATEIAQGLGNIKAANVVLLGAIARFLDFKKESWEQAIKQNIKENFVELNNAAFDKGKVSVNEKLKLEQI